MSIADSYMRGSIKPSDLTKGEVYDYKLIGTVLKENFGENNWELVIADENNSYYGRGFRNDINMYQYGRCKPCSIYLVSWCKEVICPRCERAHHCT